jgi:hypothetical protein
MCNVKIITKHKIVLIGDSHAKGCASKLHEKLKEQYEVIGYVIPGANTEVLAKTAQQEISGFTGKNVIIYCGGTNNIMRNNTSRGIKWIYYFLLNKLFFLNDVCNNPDILCISEHHLSADELSILPMTKYKMATGFSRNVDGGVCILVKNNITYQKLDLDKLNREKVFECCAVL